MIECYLCGRKLLKRDTTKDHIPPDCIFPDAKPPNLITVKCCVHCHRQFSVLDERMRNYIAVIAITQSGEVGEKARNRIMRSPEFIYDFLEHTREHPGLTSAEGDPRLLFFFTEDEMNKWLIRMVKGLHFHRFRSRMPEGMTFVVKARPELEPPEVLAMLDDVESRLGPHFAYGLVEQNGIRLWILSFYDHVLFTVAISGSNT